MYKNIRVGKLTNYNENITFIVSQIKFLLRHAEIADAGNIVLTSFDPSFGDVSYGQSPFLLFFTEA
jgi:hypothetical protein